MNNPKQPGRVEYRAERSYEVTATPEQVWEAIATAVRSCKSLRRSIRTEL